ncbi:efflux RND transporter periplasmic adaptor subunit [Chitinibacter bivalviorum]|uniref:Efflux RND transporter periplasmic adaptor subunit n=1 Tax=Chitinibacter bivalviorum TaxID=2739434 RepID=A0A7H9BM40_9NEIS|nr:efflux RND transporter periplasmic adaptor subunit [Chitinibacter bivalviorum]QLG89539.1 efflux RND transporter periplasmic adaptor subunit [Chitinibacter bivalviorum]
MNWKLNGAVLSAMASVLVLVGCQKVPEPVADIRPVRTIKVGNVADKSMGEVYSGEVRARHTVPMGFRIGGKLSSRPANVGDVVKPGQVLASLDPGDVRLSADAARAQLESSKAQLAQAELDYQRGKDLLAQKFISQAEVDKRQTLLTAARQTNEQAKSQAQLAQNQSNYAQLVSDVSGVVTQTLAEPGAVVAAGQAVVQLAKDGEREAVIDVPESKVKSWREGQKVMVVLWAGQQSELTGTVREVAPAADALTRTYRVKVTLPVSNEVKLGMTLQVMQNNDSKAIPADVSSKVSLPLPALFGKDKVQRVWVVNETKPGEGVVKSIAVNVLGVAGHTVEVGGVKPGQIVVTAGANLLREGQQVRVLQGAAHE